MKVKKAIVLALIVGLLIVIPVSAQIGDSDFSTFTVMNVSGAQTEVTVTFVDEDGNQIGPLDGLTDLGNGITNPFTLQDKEVKQIVVSLIPDAQLPTGKRYSVMITSTPGEVVANAGVAGTGSLRFSGEYSGFSSGNHPIYIPSVAYNFFGWYSMITVQNVGSGPTNITLDITCADGTTGQMTASNVPILAAHTFDFKSETPTGFTTSTQCDGSATITSSGTGPAIIAVNNQSKPTTGSMETFESAGEGDSKLYVASLSNNYFGWISALRVRKIDSGTTTVTIDYGASDWLNDTCNLTNADPACSKFMHVQHAGKSSGPSGAIITSSDSNINLLATVGSTKNATLSSGVLAFKESDGSNTVFAPNVAKRFYGWITSVTCVNVSTQSTEIKISYEGYSPAADETAGPLSEGESHQFLTHTNLNLPDGFQGGATITTTNTNAKVACTVGLTNQTGAIPGDWTTAFNAFGQ